MQILDQIGQPKQVFYSSHCPPLGKQDEWIRLTNIGPTGRKVGQFHFGGVVKDPPPPLIPTEPTIDERGLELPPWPALNPAARHWLETIANTRLHRQTHQTPLQLFAEEKSKLKPLTALPYDTALVRPLPVILQKNYQPFADQAAREQWTHLKYLGRLIEGESQRRHDRCIARRMAAARFPVIKTLDQFNWTWPKKINRAQVQHLLSLSSIIN